MAVRPFDGVDDTNTERYGQVKISFSSKISLSFSGLIRHQSINKSGWCNKKVSITIFVIVASTALAATVGALYIRSNIFLYFYYETVPF